MAIDSDEYITFQTDLFPTPDLPAFINDFEQRTNGFPVLHLLWVLMGSDGHEKRPPGLLVDNFKNGSNRKWLLKVAANADFVQTWNFSHWCVGCVCVGCVDYTTMFQIHLSSQESNQITTQTGPSSSMCRMRRP